LMEPRVPLAQWPPLLPKFEAGPSPPRRGTLLATPPSDLNAATAASPAPRLSRGLSHPPCDVRLGQPLGPLTAPADSLPSGPSRRRGVRACLHGLSPNGGFERHSTSSGRSGPTASSRRRVRSATARCAPKKGSNPRDGH